MPHLDATTPGSPRCSVHLAHRRHLQDAHWKLLNGVETERRRRYRFAADRDRFTLAAVLLRAAVGRATGVEAAAVVVDRTCDSCGDFHGRPRLPESALEVSISHSGDVVAVAVTSAGPVGVDIEQLGIGHTDLIPTVCAVSERRHVGSAADFYVYWTRKEALLKATGDGLRRPMPDVQVTPPGASPALVSLNGRPDVACRMSDLHVAGYAGAVAVLTNQNVQFDLSDAKWLLQTVG